MENTTNSKKSNSIISEEGLAFDDVLLVPQYSEILPSEVILTTKLTKNIELKTPILSAAMDTVTESKMAITLAGEGGIGIIHKNMSIDEQARQVRFVKKYESRRKLLQASRGLLTRKSKENQKRKLPN